MIRKGRTEDISAVAGIYERILEREVAGRGYTGWQKGVYPTADTAREATEQGELYVLEKDGVVAAAGRINAEQVGVYATCPWRYQAPAEQVLVLHTLVVDPEATGVGYGTRFVRFYEQLARETGRPFLRMDTNERNIPARTLYRRLGYRETAVLPCDFNGIPRVQLVCLEKYLEES